MLQGCALCWSLALEFFNIKSNRGKVIVYASCIFKSSQLIMLPIHSRPWREAGLALQILRTSVHHYCNHSVTLKFTAGSTAQALSRKCCESCCGVIPETEGQQQFFLQSLQTAAPIHDFGWITRNAAKGSEFPKPWSHPKGPRAIGSRALHCICLRCALP